MSEYILMLIWDLVTLTGQASLKQKFKIWFQVAFVKLQQFINSLWRYALYWVPF